MQPDVVAERAHTVKRHSWLTLLDFQIYFFWIKICIKEADNVTASRDGVAREENQQAESSISAPPVHARSRFEKETYTLPKFGVFKIIIWASQSLPFVPGFILKTALTFEWQLLSSGGITVKILLEAARQHCDQGLGKRQLSTQNKQGFWQCLTEFAAKRLYSQPE